VSSSIITRRPVATVMSNSPSLEVCLFGATQKCPKISNSTSSTAIATKTTNGSGSNGSPSLSSFLENNNNTKKSSRKVGSDSNDYDSLMDKDRWQQVANTHDIDLVVLRKIASQGLPDEGSYRGIVWRVLLGYLPSQNIQQEWKETLPPQRHLYRTLVDQYLYKMVDQHDDDDDNHDNHHSFPSNMKQQQRHSTLDSGRELRGQLSKTLHRDRQLRQNYNRVERLDDSMNHMADWSERERDEGDDDDENGSDDGASMVSEWTMHTKQRRPSPATPSSGTPQNSARSVAFLRSSAARRRSSSEMNATQQIYQQLPSRYQVQWKQSGIMLDKSESPAALGLNQLRIPQELLDLQQIEHQNNKFNGSSSTHLNIQDDDHPHHQSDNTLGACSSGDTSDHNEPASPIETIDDKSENADTNSEVMASTNHDDSTNDSNENSTSQNHYLDRIFQQFLQDAKTLEEIRKDVVRTHPDLRFYLEPQDNLGIRRYAALERILFVWAKLNKGVRKRTIQCCYMRHAILTKLVPINWCCLFHFLITLRYGMYKA
jgi:hypothetical protein